MEDEPIDYLKIVSRLKEEVVAVGPGQLCEPCSSMVPNTYKYGVHIFHPAGRPCMKEQ